MQARFELKLFLPYLLPRDSKIWGQDAFEYTRGEFRIGIIVLPLEKAREFPRPPEDFTAEPVDQPSEIPTFQITSTARKHFYEVLLVAVTGEISDRPEIYDNDVRAEFMNVAIRETRRFLDFCRALARDTEIFFDTPLVTPENLTFAGFPHSEGWYDPRNGAPLGDVRVNFAASEFIAGRSGLKPAPWHKVRAGVRSKHEPPLHVLTLLDARNAFARNDDKQGVLFAAIAVEVGIKRYLQNSRIDKDLLKDLEDSLEKEFWKKYFDILLKLAGAPSLKDTDPKLFENVGRLFRARNKIAHEGVCYLDRDARGEPILLDRGGISSLLDVAEKTIDWIENFLDVKK